MSLLESTTRAISSARDTTEIAAPRVVAASNFAPIGPLGARPSRQSNAGTGTKGLKAAARLQ
jgi:hypothetical protein